MVLFHLLATFRRRWFWPFCDWPMFRAAPSVAEISAVRVRLTLDDGERDWWRPHFLYRKRDFSHRCSELLRRAATAPEHAAEVSREIRGLALAMVASSPGPISLKRVTRIEVVRLTLDVELSRDVPEEDVLLVFTPPSRPEAR